MLTKGMESENSVWKFERSDLYTSRIYPLVEGVRQKEGGISSESKCPLTIQIEF